MNRRGFFAALVGAPLVAKVAVVSPSVSEILGCGTFSINEVRDMFNLNPIQFGECHFVTGNHRMSADELANIERVSYARLGCGRVPYTR